MYVYIILNKSALKFKLSFEKTPKNINILAPIKMLNSKNMADLMKKHSYLS